MNLTPAQRMFAVAAMSLAVAYLPLLSANESLEVSPVWLAAVVLAGVVAGYWVPDPPLKERGRRPVIPIVFIAVVAGFLLVRDMLDLSPGQQDATPVALLTFFASYFIGRGLRLLAAGTD
jgi:hypothetical protein